MSARVASCQCGNVRFRAAGKPILGAVCYCDDCQAAAHRLEALPGAPPILTQGGGTPYILYRKDRFACLSGGEHLKDVRLRDGAPSRRIVATCCNTAMALDFEKGHWMSVYAPRFGADAPLLEMRIQTRFKPKDATLPSDLPVYASFPPKFMAKLLRARIAMLFGA
jgi:hypothetical protein